MPAIIFMLLEFRSETAVREYVVRDKKEALATFIGRILSFYATIQKFLTFSTTISTSCTTRSEQLFVIFLWNVQRQDWHKECGNVFYSKHSRSLSISKISSLTCFVVFEVQMFGCKETGLVVPNRSSMI